MKILIAGNWRWFQYERAFSEALVKLSHNVSAFPFHQFFKSRLGHYQSALPLPGPAFLKLNQALIKKVQDTRPDVVLVWRGTHVLPQTMRSIKRRKILTVSYNNDDPLGLLAHKNAPWHHRYLWKWYIKSLKEYHQNYVYRAVNVQEAVSFGARNVSILKPYFIPQSHRPLSLNENDLRKYGCDATFVGHYEPDGREAYLRALVKAGIHTRLFGGKYWTKKVLRDVYSYFAEIRPVYGDEYAKALCSAKMCLCFLSKLNRDTYTRRCFEIPACGRLLLSERSDDLTRMFREDEEAVFFSSKEELVEKAQWLLHHPEEIERIAEAGRKRVWADGHDVISRAREFVNLVSEPVRV